MSDAISAGLFCEICGGMVAGFPEPETKFCRCEGDDLPCDLAKLFEGVFTKESKAEFFNPTHWMPLPDPPKDTPND